MKGIINVIDIEFIIIPIMMGGRSRFLRKPIVMFLADSANYLTILKTLILGDFDGRICD
jgi:hypothetical protein